jgi:hypothetical protein
MNWHYLLAGILTVLMLSTLSQSALARDFYNGEKNVQTIYGKIVDQDGDPLVARAELWYSNLSPITQELGENVSEGEEWMRNLHHATFSTQDGWYRLEAPAGEWLVRISKGPERMVMPTTCPLSYLTMTSLSVNSESSACAGFLKLM